jgi:membrane glycosyltransferase
LLEVIIQEVKAIGRCKTLIAYLGNQAFEQVIIPLLDVMGLWLVELFRAALN